MGINWCRPDLRDNCVGAYAYNQCADAPTCNAIFCCCAARWSVNHCDAKTFTDPKWAEGTQLRNGFNDLINGPEMAAALEEAPRSCKSFCGGCKNVQNMSPHLNNGWCKETNEKVLRPQGYECRAHHWVTYGSKGERQEHMVLAILKI